MIEMNVGKFIGLIKERGVKYKGKHTIWYKLSFQECLYFVFDSSTSLLILEKGDGKFDKENRRFMGEVVEFIEEDCKDLKTYLEYYEKT